MNTGFIIILVTCGARKEASAIAEALLKKRLAACVNITSEIDSKFWWKGKIDSAKETLVMLKTVRANFKKVEAEIKRLHSYEVPEIIAVPIVAGSKEYLSWIKGVVRTA